MVLSIEGLSFPHEDGFRLPILGYPTYPDKPEWWEQFSALLDQWLRLLCLLPSFLFQQFNALYPFSAPTSKLIFMASSFHHISSFPGGTPTVTGWEPPRYCFGSKETTWGFQRMRDGPLAIKKKTTCCQIYRIGRPIANGFYQKKRTFCQN